MKCFFGKIEGNTFNQIKKAFKDAVEDYVKLCEEVGKEMFKSFKGSFNVRIKPELHSKAFERAIIEGKTLNQFVQDAIKKKLQTVH